MEELSYPRPRCGRKDRSYRPWGVKFGLVYDGGGYEEWTQYYRTKFGAIISMQWNYYFASWGGSAKLFDNRKDKT